MVGGFAALAAVTVVGPRIGKYDDQGSPLPLPGSSMVLVHLVYLFYGLAGMDSMLVRH